MSAVEWKDFEMTTPSSPTALRALREDLFITDESGSPVALQGTRCLDCTRVFFPSRVICSHCGSAARMVQHRLSALGVVHASTVVRVPSALGHVAPYAYGYVDLPEDGTRIFAPFSGAALTAFAPGVKVRLTFGEIPASSMQGMLGYSFVPTVRDGHV